jgi:hypothetical protein
MLTLFASLLSVYLVYFSFDSILPYMGALDTVERKPRNTNEDNTKR